MCYSPNNHISYTTSQIPEATNRSKKNPFKNKAWFFSVYIVLPADLSRKNPFDN